MQRSSIDGTDLELALRNLEDAEMLIMKINAVHRSEGVDDHQAAILREALTHLRSAIASLRAWAHDASVAQPSVPNLMRGPVF